MLMSAFTVEDKITIEDSGQINVRYMNGQIKSRKNAIGYCSCSKHRGWMTKDDMCEHEMEGLYDEYQSDPLGNQIFIKYGKSKDRKIVFAAHMDEIGFIVNYIEENGLVRFMPVGYHG